LTPHSGACKPSTYGPARTTECPVQREDDTGCGDSLAEISKGTNTVPLPASAREHPVPFTTETARAALSKRYRHEHTDTLDFYARQVATRAPALPDEVLADTLDALDAEYLRRKLTGGAE
jgi:hypothetical protein